jgi:hypothetical protein
MLLMPWTTVVVAAAVMGAARLAGASVSARQALSVVVHANLVLVLGQIVATPFHYVRESLTSPLNLAAVLPLMQDGGFAARFFGTIDLFAAWWAGLLAVGLAALTGQRASHYAWRIAAVFVVVAAITATVTVVMGGA